MLGKVNPLRIGIDLLGSDTPPETLLQAVLELKEKLNSRAELIVLGTPDLLNQPECPDSLSCVAVEEAIEMNDDPLHAIRHKKNSSLCVGVRMLQNKELDAFISAGNTGALIASAMLSISALPGIDRPALLTLLPTKLKEIAVLDVGANVNYKVEHLLQFASMGVAYQKCRGIECPTVGLLNIGVEAKKGTPELREAYQKLQHQFKSRSDAVFIGNVEGRDVFQGHIDVLITDGFTGNVFLKTAEGIAGVILDQLQENAAEECSPHLKAVLETMRNRLHYAEYPGAVLCGVDGLVVKCHGNTSPLALINSVKEVVQLLENSFLDKIKHYLIHGSENRKRSNVGDAF